MGNPTPQRFTGRAGSGFAGRIRRALDGATDSSRRYGDTLEVDKSGRLEIRVAKGTSGLKLTKRGLELDMGAVGEKNRPQLSHMRDLESTAVLADVIEKVNELFKELRRTNNMKGGF